MSQPVRRIASAVLTAAFLAGCSRGPAQSLEKNATMRIAVPQDAKTLDPILASNTIDLFVARFMFEPLISADPRGEPFPMLAAQVPSRRNGGISANGLTITYHLRPNARWTDGAPVTSRDVRFSWQAIMNPSNDAVSRHGYDDVARIDVPGDRTVVVRLKKPFAPFVDTFFAESDQAYDVIPAHVLSRYANLNQIPFNSNPAVGDGPFRFLQWAHGDQIVLASNDGFFMGRPHLRRIVIRVVPDENTSVNLLRTHAIDYMFQASIATYPALRTVPGIRLVWDDMNAYEGMVMNMRRKPLDDRRVRLAIDYAIDRSRLVRDLTYGQEKTATEDLPEWMWAFNPSVRAPVHDAAKARALLRSAGVKLPLNLVMVTDTATVTHKREAVQIQAMLHEVGIQAEVKTYPGDLFTRPRGPAAS